MRKSYKKARFLRKKAREEKRMWKNLIILY